MILYKLHWERIDWNACHGLGYNYVQESGVLYATTEEKALLNCPINSKEGNIEITKILVIE